NQQTERNLCPHVHAGPQTVDDAGSADGGRCWKCWFNPQTADDAGSAGGELSTCKGRPPNFVRSSDDELVDTGKDNSSEQSDEEAIIIKIRNLNHDFINICNNIFYKLQCKGRPAYIFRIVEFRIPYKSRRLQISILPDDPEEKQIHDIQINSGKEKFKELLNQLDGSDSRGDVKTEFPLPDVRTKRRIFNIHTGRMTLSDDVNLEEFVISKDDLSADLHALRERHMKVIAEDLGKRVRKFFIAKNGVKYYLPIAEAKIPLGPESIEEIEEFVHVLMTI
ncbi:12328_t:CDS:2, partial [Cetraspora pellucida]